MQGGKCRCEVVLDLRGCDVSFAQAMRGHGTDNCMFLGKYHGGPQWHLKVQWSGSLADSSGVLNWGCAHPWMQDQLQVPVQWQGLVSDIRTIVGPGTAAGPWADSGNSGSCGGSGCQRALPWLWGLATVHCSGGCCRKSDCGHAGAQLQMSPEVQARDRKQADLAYKEL